MKRKFKKLLNRNGGILVTTALVIWTLIFLLFIKPLILKGYPLCNDVTLLLFFISGFFLFIINTILVVLFLFNKYKKYFSPRRKRKIAKFFLGKLAILITPTTVVAFLQPNIINGNYKDGQLWWLGLTLLMSIASLLIYNFVSKPSIHHFEKIVFGDCNETIIERAIEGIINAEKAQPEFVHAAPISEKAARDAHDIITKSVTAKTFYYIIGRPGEGKSMYAYHLSYLLSKKGYKVYLLTLTSDIGGSLEEIKKELDYLNARKKIILIDEAHNLEGITKKLFIQALCENMDFINQDTDSKNLNEIICWINTEFFEEQMHIARKDSEYLDVQKFLPELIAKFYLSDNLAVRNILINKIDGLEEAINKFKGVKEIKENFSQLNASKFKTALESYFKNEIEDPWTFNFIASGAEIKLVDELKYLTPAQKFILFFISAKVVISGDRNLLISHLSQDLSSVRSHLYSHNSTSLNKTIKELQKNLNESELKHKKFISVSPKKANTPDYISAHHYKTARVLVNSILKSMPGEENELLKAVSVFLSGDKKQLKNLVTFFNEIEKWTFQFINEYVQLLQEFFNQPEQVNNLEYYPQLLDFIKKVAPGAYIEICKNLDGEKWAKLIRQANVNQFAPIGHFIFSLDKFASKITQHFSKDYFNEFITKISIANSSDFRHASVFIRSLKSCHINLVDYFIENHYKNLAQGIGNSIFEDFGNTETLINSFGSSKFKLLKELTDKDYKNLAQQISNATVENYSQAADLINSFGSSKFKLLTELTDKDYENIAQQISNTTVENFSQTAELISSLDTFKYELIKQLESIDGAKLNGVINSLSINQFELLANFLFATENFGINLLAQINFEQIITKLNQHQEFTISILMGLTKVISLMKNDQRNKFISKINWERIYFLLPLSYEYIIFYGFILSNLIQSCNSDLESPPVKKVSLYISSHSNIYATEVLKIHISQFNGLAKFLRNCNLIDNAIAIQLTRYPFFQNLLNKTVITPKYFGSIANIINSMRFIDLAQTLKYIKSHKIQKNIPRVFNSKTWHNSKNTNLAQYEKEKKEAFQLIRAIFITSKEEWLKIRNKLECRKLKHRQPNNLVEGVPITKKRYPPPTFRN